VICFVTDRRRAADPSCSYLLERIHDAAVSGVDLIQIRERDLPDRELMALVREALTAVRHTAARILINDRVDIALAAGAAGVQLRGDSVDAARVRGMVPHGFVIGRSIHDPGEAAAVRDGDFLVFGTVFPSAGKAPGYRFAGVELLRDACARSRLPVLAIGGVDETNALTVAGSGAAGIAAVGMFMAARPVGELESVVRAIRAAFAS
jgi:thiamine-phosphate diphosphorylase